jgi:anhydro-N-acetylmuramic acid kinase
MSGTSADGIDAALIRTDGLTIQDFGETYFLPYPEDVKQDILRAYGHPPGPQTRALTHHITTLHGLAVASLLEKAKLSPSHVDVIGFHGQTIFHCPPRVKGEQGETHILSDGQLLAQETTIPVIDQFRLNDIAHGGQGAPFVPLFHQALTRDLPKPLAVLNIGGVANVTWIGREEDHLIAFDTGPGNGLIDDWVRAHTGLPWDDKGQLAAKGIVHEELLRKWLSQPYFALPAPKSLDRLTFKDCLKDAANLSVADGAATLTAFTAATIERALFLFPETPQHWIVAGGGAHNETLLMMLGAKLGTPLKKARDQGWNGDALEAQAFGFLAVRSLKNLPLSLPGTTGVPYPLQGGRFHHPPPKD